MRALVQRVSQARVEVDGELVGEIGVGLLVFVCAMKGDTLAQGERLLDKLLKLRVFADGEGRMNRNVQNVDGQGQAGGLLLVSQFTLAAELEGGNRPSFSAAMDPSAARQLFEALVERARLLHPRVAAGRFAAHMQVRLVNDGPVTIPLDIRP